MKSRNESSRKRNKRKGTLLALVLGFLYTCNEIIPTRAFLPIRPPLSLHHHRRILDNEARSTPFVLLSTNNSTAEDPGALERYRKRQLRRRRQGKSQQQQQQRQRRITKSEQNISVSEQIEVADDEQRNGSSWQRTIRSPAPYAMHHEDDDEEELFPHQQQQQQEEEESSLISQHSENNSGSGSSSVPPIVNTTPPYDLPRLITQQSNQPPSSLFHTTRRPLKQQQSRWRRVVQTTRNIVNVPQALKQKARGTLHRTVKRIRVRWTTRFEEEEEGVPSIRDVEYEYVRHHDDDAPMDVQVIPLVDKPQSNQVQRIRMEDRHQQQQQGEQETLEQSYYSMNDPATRMILPPSQQQPPAKRRRRRPNLSELKSASRSPKDRRIYNPYKETSPENMDSVDRIGKFLADTVDQLFWGQYDDSRNNEETSRPLKQEQQPQQQQRTRRQGRQPVSSTEEYTTSRHYSQRQQHWKDRLEERFDSFMGIHKDGDAYNRWFQEENEGASPASHSSPRKRSVNKDKPFWEQEGSLIALLLGRTKDGKRVLSWEKALTPRGGDGSLVTIFRTVAQTVLVLASYAFRWATVRGALPQPVVVLGVSAAGLCVRQHRVRAMVLALILFRTVGELVHGGLYGQDGWEDDNDEEETTA